MRFYKTKSSSPLLFVPLLFLKTESIFILKTRILVIDHENICLIITHKSSSSLDILCFNSSNILSKCWAKWNGCRKKRWKIFVIVRFLLNPTKPFLVRITIDWSRYILLLISNSIPISLLHWLTRRENELDHCTNNKNEKSWTFVWSIT